MRAAETWQQAGAYYVRIQAMARQHHITLREEFDEHDTPDTKYIVVLDDDFPVATCRLYELPEESDGEGAPVRPMMFGRIVVLPEYRKQGLGRLIRNESDRGVALIADGRARRYMPLIRACIPPYYIPDEEGLTVASFSQRIEDFLY